MTKNQERKAVVLPQITETMMSRCPSTTDPDEDCFKEELGHHEQSNVEQKNEGQLKLPVLVWPKEEARPGRNSESPELFLSNIERQATIKTNSESFREELKALKEDLKQLGTYRSPPASSVVEKDAQYSQETYDGLKASERYQEELKALKENMRQLVAEYRDVILEARIRDEEAKKQANEEKKAARNAAKLADRMEPPSADFSKTAKALIKSRRLIKTDKDFKSESALANTTDKDKKDSDEESMSSSHSKDDIVHNYGKDISVKTRMSNNIGGNEVQSKTLKDVVNEVARAVNNRNGDNNLRPISEETSDGTHNNEKTRNTAKSVKRTTSPSNDITTLDNEKVNRKQNLTEETELIKNATSEKIKYFKTDKNDKELLNNVAQSNGNHELDDTDEPEEQINAIKRVNGKNHIADNNQLKGITSEDIDFFQSQRLRREFNKETFDNRLSDLDSISSIADKTIGTSRRSSDAGLPGNRSGKDKKWYMNRYRVPKVPMEIALQLHKLGFEFESNRIRDLHIDVQTCENNLKKAISQEKRDAIEEKKRIEREAREKERREAQRRRMLEIEAQETKRKELEAIEREKRRLAAIERRKHNLELIKNINNTILQSKASRAFRFSYFPFLPKPKRHFLTPSPELTENGSDESGSEMTEDEETEYTPVSRVSCHSARQKIISRK